MSDAWAGILTDGENILWQGRPDGKVTFSIANILPMIFGTLFSGFALFWMIMASKAGGVFWMFGLLHFFVGLSIGIGPIIWDTIRRRNSWYTLTDRRAFIATHMPLKGKALDSYAINADTSLTLVDETPATVYFASGTKRGPDGRRVPQRIGFARIADGHEVYRMMLDIQANDRQARRSEGP